MVGFFVWVLQRWLKDCRSALAGSFQKSIFNTILHTVWRARFWRTQTNLDFPWNRMSFVMTMLEGVRTGTFMPLSARDSHFVSKTMAVPIMQQFAKSVESAWETVAECISGISLDYGDAAFTDWFYGETAIRKRSQLWASWQTMWKEWDLSHARCQFWRWRRVRIKWLW